MVDPCNFSMANAASEALANLTYAIPFGSLVSLRLTTQTSSTWNNVKIGLKN